MSEDKELHIIITGESGGGRSYIVRQSHLRRALYIAICSFFCLFVGTLISIKFFSSNYVLKRQIANLSYELEDSSNGRVSEQQKNQAQLADIKVKEALLQKYKKQLSTLQKKHETMLEESITRLDERARAIESIIDSLGVEIDIEEDPQHSGGIFIPQSEDRYQEKLLAQTEQYLKFLQSTPIGKPIQSAITSSYGRRKDPLNRRNAFHEGVDFRGKTGAPVAATANGVVKKSAYSKDYGNFIVIKHKNGYKTLFAHLSKRLVKRGEKVTRGQAIGLVGNTGRSTGPHLHYELHHNGKPVNPMKYIKVADLSFTVTKSL